MKYLITIIIITFMWIIWFSFAENFPYQDKSVIWNDIKMDYSNTKMKNIIAPWDSAWEKIRDKYLPWTKDQAHPIIYYVSKVINYFLWLLAFFTFIIILWWASMTFTWKTDEWVKKWIQFMKMWIITIIIIWISWLISMFIFNIYNSWVK